MKTTEVITTIKYAQDPVYEVRRAQTGEVMSSHLLYQDAVYDAKRKAGTYFQDFDIVKVSLKENN